MEELINNLDISIVGKTVLFFATCGIVMLYYYIEDWYQNFPKMKLLDYLIFDNPKGTYGAIKRLILLSFGAGLVGHLEDVNNIDILISGAGIGWLAYSGKSEVKKNEKL